MIKKLITDCIKKVQNCSNSKKVRNSFQITASSGSVNIETLCQNDGTFAICLEEFSGHIIRKIKENGKYLISYTIDSDIEYDVFIALLESSKKNPKDRSILDALADFKHLTAIHKETCQVFDDETLSIDICVMEKISGMLILQIKKEDNNNEDNNNNMF